MNLTFDQVHIYWAHRFPNERIQSREKVAVRCLFHDDGNPSCTLFLNGGGSYHCHACSRHGSLLDFEEKVSKCGREEAQRNVATITGAKIAHGGLGAPIAVYKYVDEAGIQLFEKHRYEPSPGTKDFRIFRRINGKLQPGIDDAGNRTRRILFNLPAVVTAAICIVCEGEKDCVNVHGVGLFAAQGLCVACTTSFDGAWGVNATKTPKWLESYNPFFTGKLVFILKDNDDAGRTYAQHVAKSIMPYAREVRTVSLPGLAEKGDVSDYLKDHTAAELEHELMASIPWASPAVEIAATMSMTEAVSSTSVLLDQLEAFINTYVVITPEQSCVLALWVLHTYVIDAVEVTPYLSIQGPEKECGKSLLMDVLSAVCLKSRKIGGGSAAALIRVVDKKKPTLFIDEMDAIMAGNKEMAETLRGFLDCGFSRDLPFDKCVGADFEVKAFEVFGPKCFAGIGSLPGTVASRSISIEMQRKLPSESRVKFRQKKVKAAAALLKAAAEQWAQGAISLLMDLEPEPLSELSGRRQDISEILLAIATLAGQERLERTRQALLGIFKSVPSEDSSLGVILLSDMRDIFDARRAKLLKEADQMPSKELVGELIEIEGRPWPEMPRGKALTVNNLASHLKKYGIHPQTIRVMSTTPKGYRRSDCEDSWARYCAPVRVSAATSPQTLLALANAELSDRNEAPDVAIQRSGSYPHQQCIVAPVAVHEEDEANDRISECLSLKDATDFELIDDGDTGWV